MAEEQQVITNEEIEAYAFHRYASMNPKVVQCYKNMVIGLSRVSRGRDDELWEVIKEAILLGFRKFDFSGITGPILNDRFFEENLVPERENLYYIGESASKSPELILKDLEAACERLHTDYLDLFLLSNQSRCYTEGDGTGMVECLKKAKEMGIIREYGFRNSRISVITTAIESCAYPVVCYPLNYLSTQKELDLLKLAGENGINFMADRVDANGMITDYSAAAAYLLENQRKSIMLDWTVTGIPMLNTISNYVDKVADLFAPGGSGHYLTPEMNKHIRRDRFVNGSFYCRDCHACEPCPKGIEIGYVASLMQKIYATPYPEAFKERPKKDYAFKLPENTDMVAKRVEKVDTCIECEQCRNKCPFAVDAMNLIHKNQVLYQRFNMGMED